MVVKTTYDALFGDVELSPLEEAEKMRFFNSQSYRTEFSLDHGLPGDATVDEIKEHLKKLADTKDEGDVMTNLQAMVLSPEERSRLLKVLDEYNHVVDSAFSRFEQEGGAISEDIMLKAASLIDVMPDVFGPQSEAAIGARRQVIADFLLGKGKALIDIVAIKQMNARKK